jgi:hypothetical protein
MNPPFLTSPTLIYYISVGIKGTVKLVANVIYMNQFIYIPMHRV